MLVETDGHSEERIHHKLVFRIIGFNKNQLKLIMAFDIPLLIIFEFDSAK